ncbi:MAG: DUF3368 domain-containing protein [Firmicutes bacterium]|nr:DUF3368 domain-containing protein [Bacillota bacterium]
MKAIINSSPLIALGGIKKLELLPKIFSEIVIPQEVYNETVVNGKDDTIFKAIDGNAGFKIVSANNLILIEFLNDYLDKGEAEVIALAKELGINNVIIDEAKGRKIAKRHSLDVIGSLGILVIAKHKELINNVGEQIKLMIQNGIRISDDVKLKILEMSGE